MAATLQELRQQIADKEAEFTVLQQRVKDPAGQLELLLPLSQQLLSLRQEELLLIKQEAGAIGAACLTAYTSC
jgi:hypothetical protein